MEMMLAVIAYQLGSTDCEALGDGGLAQPVNAITSLGFVAVGAVLAVRGLRRRDAMGWQAVAFGVILASVGLGSAAFHGPQPGGSQLAHDVPIAAALLFVLVFDLVLLGFLQRMMPIFLIGIAALSAVFALAPETGAVVTGLVAAGAVVAETLIYVRKVSHLDDSRLKRRDVSIALIMIAALVGYWLGRTGSVVCDPDSILQLHGLWHVLAAAAFAVWGFTTFPSSGNQNG